MSCIKKFNYPLFESGLVDKSQHASFLFDKMRTFQRNGFLCDVQAPSHEDVVPAHKVVLMSARSSEGDHPMTPASPDDESPRPFYPVDDVFLVDEAYSPVSNNGDATEDEKNNSLRRRLSTLNELWESRSCCDVTLVADECRCDAHKVVLAACSSYFSAMFKSEMKEKAMHTITLKGIDSGFFRRMLDFIYKGELLNADVEETMEMLNVAVFYQIVPLINWCNNFLLRNVSSRQVCALYAQSKDLALKEVTESCKSYIHDHFVEMDSVDSEICVLSAEDMASCLKSNRLGGFSNSKTEASILRIVLRWLLHNPQVPPMVQNEIISNVRFALIHPNDILKCSRDVAASAPNYNADMADIPYYNFYSFGPVFRSRVIQALVYHERRFAQPLFQNEVTELRTTEMKLVTVDGVLAQNPVKLPSGSRKVLPARYQKGAVRKIQCRDPYHSVVELNGFIYTIGGTRTYQDGFSRSVVRYDPRLDESIQVACMNEKRGDFVAVTYGDYIFVFGGRNRHGVLTSCERYDPAKNIWEFISDLPQPIYMAAGVEYKGCIYISGGFNNCATVEGMLLYNPVQDSWSQIHSPMVADRGYHVMIKGHDGRLWVVGGVDNPFSGRNVWEVEAFDFNTEMWHFMGQVLPVKLFECTVRLNAMLNKDGHICISAVSSPEKYPMVEYHPDKHMWLEMKNSLEYSEVVPNP